MRLVTFEDDRRVVRVGVVKGEDRVLDVSDVASTMLDVIRGGEFTREALEVASTSDHESFSLAEVTLLAPIPRPAKNILCLGMNYSAHVAEGVAAGAVSSDDVSRSRPVWFTKAVTSVCGPFDDIVVEPGLSTAYDWEVELGVVIGHGGRHISVDAALEHVHSYTVINDVSARDIQMAHGGQFFKGKSLDRSSPMGPCLVTADEIPDPHSLELRCRVSGSEVQHGNSRDMLWDIAESIADISEVLTLEPGDIIATGTPAGVGLGRTPPVFLTGGTVLESEISGIGLMRNRVIEAREPSSASHVSVN